MVNLGKGWKLKLQLQLNFCFREIEGNGLIDAIMVVYKDRGLWKEQTNKEKETSDSLDDLYLYPNPWFSNRKTKDNKTQVKYLLPLHRALPNLHSLPLTPKSPKKKGAQAYVPSSHMLIAISLYKRPGYLRTESMSLSFSVFSIIDLPDLNSMALHGNTFA